MTLQRTRVYSQGDPAPLEHESQIHCPGGMTLSHEVRAVVMQIDRIR